jgi:hypothetical protein
MLRICLLFGVALLIGCGGSEGSSTIRVSVARFGELETEPVQRKFFVNSQVVAETIPYGVFTPWSPPIESASVHSISTTGFNGDFFLPTKVEPQTKWARMLLVSGYGRGTNVGWYPEAHPFSQSNFFLRIAAFYEPLGNFDWYLRDTSSKDEILIRSAVSVGGNPAQYSAEFPATGKEYQVVIKEYLGTDIYKVFGRFTPKPGGSYILVAANRQKPGGGTTKVGYVIEDTGPTSN